MTWIYFHMLTIWQDISLKYKINLTLNLVSIKKCIMFLNKRPNYAVLVFNQITNMFGCYLNKNRCLHNLTMWHVKHQVGWIEIMYLELTWWIDLYFDKSWVYKLTTIKLWSLYGHYLMVHIQETSRQAEMCLAPPGKRSLCWWLQRRELRWVELGVSDRPFFAQVTGRVSVPQIRLDLVHMGTHGPTPAPTALHSSGDGGSCGHSSGRAGLALQ